MASSESIRGEALGVRASDAPITSDKRVLWTLISCSILAQADKNIMGLLAAPIQASLALDDVQLGLLHGLAFSLFYAVAAIPLGWLLDRSKRRVGIAGLCVAIWSLATMGGGLAWTFGVLFMLRCLTAIAEAGLAPAASSLISQMGGRREVMRASSLFMLAPYLGSGLALIGGGAILHFATDMVDDPWRLVFVAMGLPGLVLAPLLGFRIKERRRPTRSEVTTAVSVRSILQANRFLPYHYAAMTAMFLALFAFVAWYPMFLLRQYGMPVASGGPLSGATFLVMGCAGTLGAGVLSRRLKDDSPGALLRGFSILAFGAAVAAASQSLVGSPVFSMIAYGMFALLAAMVTAMMLVPLQLTLEPWMQARASALLGFCTAAIAGSLGPLFVGSLTGNLGMSLGTALAIVSGGATLLASVLFLIGYKKYSGPEA